MNWNAYQRKYYATHKAKMRYSNRKSEAKTFLTKMGSKNDVIRLIKLAKERFDL